MSGAARPEARISRPDPANLIIGILISDPILLPEVRAGLETEFGPIDAESPIIAFDCTDYYGPEMGTGLQRLWLSHERLIEPGRLAELKLATGRLEDRWRTAAGARRVNLDPGLLSLYSLVLATTKNYSHRVYLGHGIYAEVTLIYEHSQFQSLRWTYADYQGPVATAFLQDARTRYLEKQKTWRRD